MWRCVLRQLEKDSETRDAREPGENPKKPKSCFPEKRKKKGKTKGKKDLRHVELQLHISRTLILEQQRAERRKRKKIRV